jgi:hypothetical protein
LAEAVLEIAIAYRKIADAAVAATERGLNFAVLVPSAAAHPRPPRSSGARSTTARLSP